MRAAILAALLGLAACTPPQEQHLQYYPSLYSAANSNAEKAASCRAFVMRQTLSFNQRHAQEPDVQINLQEMQSMYQYCLVQSGATI